MRNSIRIVVSITGFLAAWEVVARIGFVPRPLFPPPSGILMALVEMARTSTRWPAGCCRGIPQPLRSDLLMDTGVSLERAAVGWAAGIFAGIVLGLATGRIPALQGYVVPIIQLFRPLPPVAIIPVIIVWFGIGDASKIFSIAFAVFFPVWINAHAGAQKVPESFIWSARSLKANQFTIFRRVIFPGALPFIAAGLRTGVATAFVMVYVSELAGSSSGLGYEISTSHLAYRVDRMLAALFVLGALGAASDFLLVKMMNARFPWLKYLSQK